MRRKYFLVILFLILAIFLTGCGVAPGIPEWMSAEEVIYNYWQAIINRQYVLAKWYCIIGGVWDYKTDEWE